MKALVLDDEADILDIIVEALASNNFQATGVTTPQEALEILKKNQFSAIITDIMLPDMDGFEFIFRVREQGLKIPVIALTGLADLGKSLFDQEDGRPRARPDIMLEKPFSYQMFYDALNSLVDQMDF